MEFIVNFICILIILWALELRFKENKKCIGQLEDDIEDLKNKIEKTQTDVVNLYLKGR